MKAHSPHRLSTDFSTLNGYRNNPRRLAAGFSLIEVLVGMVIGMLGIIVIMQVFALFEGQKRTTSGGAEAQNTGAIAMASLSDDIRQSGYGFTLSSLNMSNVTFTSLVGCNLVLPAVATRPAVTLSPLAPVVINSASVAAGDANTDTLLVVYGNSYLLPEGNPITVPVVGAGTTQFAVQNYLGFNLNDYVIAVPQNRACVSANPATAATLSQVTAINGPPGPLLTIAPATPAAGGVGGVVPGMIFNMGQSPTINAYAVRNSSLTVCNYMVSDCSNAANTGNAAIWVPIAGNIVSMRAQYGQDISALQGATIQTPKTLGLTFMDGIVDIYSQTSPTNIGAVATNPANALNTVEACGWLRTLSVRIALIARNSQPEKTQVTALTAALAAANGTAPPPVWAGSTATNNNPIWVAAGGSVAGATANPIDLSKNPDGTANTRWQFYRYKVFQTTVPIRNNTSGVTMGVQSGC